MKCVSYALVRAGYDVGIAGCTLPAGMPREVGLYPDWRERVRTCDAVLLPLPTVRSGDLLAYPEEDIPFSAFLSTLRPGTVLLAGMIPEARRREAEAAGMTVYDYYESEAVKARNAVLTAEGALSIAMQELPVALDESRVAVVGCGRIGVALCRMLRAMHAEVTALSRSATSLRTPERLGCRTVLLTAEALKEVTSGYDAVFTTVPHRIFTGEILRSASLLPGGRKTLYIDLSSSPGSFDPAAARESGIRLLWALSLPGKYAPDSAGRVLATRILALLREGDRSGTSGADAGEGRESP